MNEQIDKGRLVFGSFGLVMIVGCIVAWYKVYEKIIEGVGIFDSGLLFIGIFTGFFGIWILKRGITQKIMPQATIIFTTTILAISGLIIYLSFY